jgi:hypothetical protein
VIREVGPQMMRGEESLALVDKGQYNHGETRRYRWTCNSTQSCLIKDVIDILIASMPR